jgi:hypothetical protein
VKKFLLFAAIVGIIVVQGYKVLDRKAEERNAHQRVSLMFERLKTGILADEQEAIGYWRVGHPESPSDETANAFAKFRGQRNLSRIESYSIVSSQLIEGNVALGRHVDFQCVVNGRPLRIRATHKLPLEWLD